MKLSVPFSILLALTFTALTQQLVFGQQKQQPNELQGVKKIFVDTHTIKLERDPNKDKIREQIIKEIRKKLPELQIVGLPEEADVHLRLKVKDQVEGSSGERRPVPGIIIPIGRAGISTGGSSLVCIGSVVKFVDDERPRILSESECWMKSPFDQKPWIKFARDFIKAYEKAK